MDPVVHHNPSQSTLSPISSSRRRGSRENETPAQRQKREKAAERQRRKRERDRHVNNLNAAMSYPQPTETPPPPQPQPPQPPNPQAFTGQELSAEELARRERVRAAARERQRKHRSLVKQRKMRELGLDMTSDMLPGIDEVQFRVNGQNEYQVLPHEMGHPHPMNPQDPSFPQPLTGGQSFASTLLLSFSCTQPMLKQQLLRTLSLTSEDLAALEPIIADAFDQWDHQVRCSFRRESWTQCHVFVAAYALCTAGCGKSSGWVNCGTVRAPFPRYERPLDQWFRRTTATPCQRIPRTFSSFDRCALPFSKFQSCRFDCGDDVHADVHTGVWSAIGPD